MSPGVRYNSGSPESWNTNYPGIPVMSLGVQNNTGSLESWNTKCPGIPRISHIFPDSYLQPVSPRFLVYYLVSQVDMKYCGVMKNMEHCTITYYINYHRHFHCKI